MAVFPWPGTLNAAGLTPDMTGRAEPMTRFGYTVALVQVGDDQQDRVIARAPGELLPALRGLG